MLPVQVEFPKFVADQLLTSEDLNQLFGYLDEQNRLTRTNLIGIGIVCGLQLDVNNTNTEVTITKGCGVTSEGYLITTTTKTYKQYKKYKVDTARVYDKFYKLDGGGNKIPMDVWELKQPGVDPDLQSIDAGFLKDKVILLFVELKEENNKNCDPGSCDDKGINVTVSFLPMAVFVDDAKLLMGTTAGAFGANTYTALPEVRMKRWDLPNSSPVYTQDIFNAYFKLLDKTFIDSVETTLSNMYSVFGSLVATDYGANPFAGLSAKFAFLYDGGASLNQLVHLQYHYDFFSDLLLAYQEFRKAGTAVLSTCCPESDLFPRHLLLGEAIPSVTTGLFPYRHYFIYSPLFDHQNMVGGLKSLFNRLVVITEQFFLPAVQGNNTREDTFLRITPSVLGDLPLSVKAIPYYYQVNNGSRQLYTIWDYKRTLLNDAKRNLSYHATQYNPADPFVTTPLNFDLEPYNFLRVEGVVGKSYGHVLRQVKQQITSNRLPVDIIALNTEAGIASLRQLNIAANDVRGSETGMEMLCHFQDLESMYDSLRNEILCMLCKELKYYYDFTFAMFSSFLEKFKIAGEASEVGLFDVCSKGYKIKNRSLGLMIEFLYREGYTDETLTLENFFEAFGISVEDLNNDDIPDNLSGQASTLFLAMLNFFKIPLGIIRLSALLTEDLAEFDARAYCAATDKMGEYAKSLKAIFDILTRSQKDTATGDNTRAGSQPAGGATAGSTGSNTNSLLSTGSTTTELARLANTDNGFAAILMIMLLIEDLMDHLDVLIYHCKCSALRSLKEDYLQRYALLTRLRQFGYFTRMHPGIQHKCGVPMGGTFIIVYHSRKRKGLRIERNDFFKASGELEIKDIETVKKFTSNPDTIQRKTLVAGFVLAENKKPVAGATVTIAETGETTTTSAKGLFKLVGSIVPYTLYVEAAGYEDYEEEKTDDDDNVRIVLQELKGEVLDQLAPGTVIADFYLPYRCCSDCPPVQYIVNDTPLPPPPNQGPVANAGSDQVITLPTSSVTLNGTGSTDPDGTITAFQWTKLSGPGSPAFVTQNSAQTNVKDLVEGVFVFELSVTDDKGSIARDQVQVTVHPAPPPPNKSPVADAGKDQTIVLSPTKNEVLLDGSLSKDEDGTIVGYRWNQVSGPTVNIVSPSLQQTVVNGLQPGVYEFELTVTDNDGATGSDKITITVAPPANLPPSANAGPDQFINLLRTNNTVTLNGSNSTDPEGKPLTFKWTLAGGTNKPNIVSDNTEITDVTGLVVGDYKFELTVTDDQGATSTAPVTVHTFMEETVPQKSCGPLSEIVQVFGTLEGTVNAELFKAFRNAFGLYDQAQEYFKVLQSIQNEAPAKQLDFFAGLFNNQDTPALLTNWLTSLQKIILEINDLRGLALRFYSVLVRLSMYIVCIQKEDMDVATVLMTRVFSLVQRHVKQWVDMIATGAFAPPDIAIVKNIGEYVEKEMVRVKDNREDTIKVKYFNVLVAIVKMINSTP